MSINHLCRHEHSGYCSTCDAENRERDRLRQARSESEATQRPRREDAITFSIPCLPAYTLSPNSREHWATKSAESRAARSTAQLAWFDHRFDTGQPPISGPVALTWTVFLPKRGKPRDIDNLIPCMKPLLDGLVDGRVIAGDTPDIVRRVDVAQVPWAEHRGESFTLVRIEPVEA